MSAIKFKLTLPTKTAENGIAYPDKIMLVGSCFTENIGAKLQFHLFETLQNPHGILFNPVSVRNALMDYIHGKVYTREDLFFLNDVWNCWHHHSRFSGVTQEEALQKINNSIATAHDFLKKANHLVITLGSAWLYTLNEQAGDSHGMVVANNHKAPSHWFTKKLLTPNELLLSLQQVQKALLAFNPKLNIIYTISPVRHLREGLVENNRSKAILIQAVHELVEKESNCVYFPAYEYVIDDLRDYRFYSEDLVHPNYLATNYVWERLMETYMNASTQALMKQIAEIQLAISHKPFFEGSSEHQKFLLSYLEKTQQLANQFPHLSLQNHIQFFKSHIAK